MTSGMPELGSKISLISKADIRYEGRLYTVDPQECTIALSSVRSFGTEDRETQYQIAPQSQIYEYILFRGSDIKDIRVINNSLPHPNDPAIMQVQIQNGQHLMPHFSMQNMTVTQAPVMGNGGSVYGGTFAGGTMSGLGGITSTTVTGPVPSLAPGAPAPYMLGNQQQQQQPQQQQQQQMPKTMQSVQSQPQPQLAKQQQSMLAATSRSTTPMSLISRKSPSNGDMGVNQQQQHHHRHHQQQQQQQMQQNHHQTQQSHQYGNQHLVNQNHIGGGGGQLNKRQNYHQSHQQQQQQQPQQQQQQRGNQRNKNDYYHYQSQNNNVNNRRDRRDNNLVRSTDYMNQGSTGIGITANGINHVRNYNNRRGGNNMPNNRGRWNDGGFSWVSKAGFKQTLLPRNNKNQIKFEQDFDFEQANNKFEELRSQLSKLKVGDEPKPSDQINGETDKKDDSGNETGAGEHEHEEDEITVGYDKTKSFFDNISCEAAQDRTKNKGHDWRQERKLNSETFGVSSTRRGGYRGSYYNNRNVIGGGSGYNAGGSVAGYNRNYRNGNNFRNRSNNRNNTLNRDTTATTGRNVSNSTDANTSASTTTTINNNNINATKNQTQQPHIQGSAIGRGDGNVNGGLASASKPGTVGLSEKTNQSPIITGVGAAAGQ